MTSYHVSVLRNSSIEIGCPNNGAQFGKCGLQGCAKYALIKMLQYQHGVQYLMLGKFVE